MPLLLLVLVLASAPALAQDALAVVPGAAPTERAPTDRFTGVARVGNRFEAAAPARMYGATVAFEPGARTHWHAHPLGQTLVVTAGTGHVQHWGGSVEEVRPGDVVVVPPGVKHWHGAGPDGPMTHVATVERPAEGVATEWMEPVTDAQYAASAMPAPEADEPSRAQQLLGDIAPALADLTDDVLYGQVWADPALSPRDRSLVTVSALVALDRPDQLRSHLGLALRNGVTEDEVVAAITHLAFYAGWPSAVTAVGLAREAFQEN
ncbi:MAG: carboxymuconolactone decarboxylase [Rhodothermaceae bacterium]|nr:carboxymuconolactone decarboxylase [Rhodothermaceae bacterium]